MKPMSGDNFQQRVAIPLLKVVPSAGRREAQMKVPSGRMPRGKYAGGVLEHEKA